MVPDLKTQRNKHKKFTRLNNISTVKRYYRHRDVTDPASRLKPSRSEILMNAEISMPVWCLCSGVCSSSRSIHWSQVIVTMKFFIRQCRSMIKEGFFFCLFVCSSLNDDGVSLRQQKLEKQVRETDYFMYGFGFAIVKVTVCTTSLWDVQQIHRLYQPLSNVFSLKTKELFDWPALFKVISSSNSKPKSC